MEILDSFHNNNKLNSIEEEDDEDDNYYDEKIAQEILMIFNNSNENWENDDVVVQNVKNWSKLKKISHSTLFKCIKNRSTNKKYACLLGFLYRWGIGTAQDQEKAFRWYKVSAEMGDSLGQNELGSCYDYADGTELGQCYSHGFGVKQDLRKGYYWLCRAAAAGNTMAQSLVADRQQYGMGTFRDIHEAIKWHRKVIQAMEQPEYPKLIWLFQQDL
ncbi:6279_t:CDS:2 [Ambispora leptoticha]|uniref:6279_t:CDS:1 n=1 Tax=Ambispora leptoticha TaxID=144679 RepID=A0A9N8ZKE6_9GLOM|nr:6279_t:CDS:2 [Ambispora leptoticha]